MDETNLFHHGGADDTTSVNRLCTYNDTRFTSEFPIQTEVFAAEEHLSDYEELELTSVLPSQDHVILEYGGETCDKSVSNNDVIVVDDDTDGDIGIIDSSDDDIESLYLDGISDESCTNECMEVDDHDVIDGNVDISNASTSMIVPASIATEPDDADRNMNVEGTIKHSDNAYSEFKIIKCEPTDPFNDYENLTTMSDTGMCSDSELSGVQTVKQDSTHRIQEIENEFDASSELHNVKIELNGRFRGENFVPQTVNCVNDNESSNTSRSSELTCNSTASLSVINNETFKVEYESIDDGLDTTKRFEVYTDFDEKPDLSEENNEHMTSRTQILVNDINSDFTARPISNPIPMSSNKKTVDPAKCQSTSKTDGDYAQDDVKFKSVELLLYCLNMYYAKECKETTMTGMLVKPISKDTSDAQHEYICTNIHNGKACNRCFTSSDCFLNHCLCKYLRGFYECPVCGLVMRNCDTLDIHLKRHCIWLHTCARCNHGFADKESLQFHEIICSNTKRLGPSQYSRYVCDLCNELHKLPQDMYSTANLDEAILPYLVDDANDDCYEVDPSAKEPNETLTCVKEPDMCNSDYCQTDDPHCISEDEPDVGIGKEVDVDVEADVNVMSDTNLIEEIDIGSINMAAQTENESLNNIPSSCSSSTTNYNAQLPERDAYVKHINPGLVNHMYVCSECEQSFELFNCCRSHIAERHKHSGYSCVVCGFKVNSFNDLASHLIYHDVWIYTCHVCKYGFATANELLKHESTCMSTPESFVKDVNTGPSLYFTYVCTTCRSLHKIGGSSAPTASPVYELRNIFPYTEHTYIRSPWDLRADDRRTSLKVHNIQNKIIYLKVVYARSSCAVSISYVETSKALRPHGVHLTNKGQKVVKHSKYLLTMAMSLLEKPNSGRSLEHSENRKTSRKQVSTAMHKKIRRNSTHPNFKKSDSAKRVNNVSHTMDTGRKSTITATKPWIVLENSVEKYKTIFPHKAFEDDTYEIDNSSLCTEWCEMDPSCVDCLNLSNHKCRDASLKWCKMGRDCDLCMPPVRRVPHSETTVKEMVNRDIDPSRYHYADYSDKQQIISTKKDRGATSLKRTKRIRSSKWIAVLPNKGVSRKELQRRACVCISLREMKFLLSENVLGEIEYKQDSQGNGMIRLPDVVIGLDDIGQYLNNADEITMSEVVEPNTADNCLHVGRFYVCKLCGRNFKVDSCFASHVKKSHSRLPQINIIDGFSILLYSCCACSIVFDSLAEMKDHRFRQKCTVQTVQQRCSVCNAFHVRMPVKPDD